MGTFPSNTSVKTYIDNQIQGLDIKNSVLVATTQNIDLSNIGSTPTIDGITISVDKRVLVKNQTDPKENGIYISKTVAWERADDFNENDEILGSFTFVEEGTINGNMGFVCTTNGPITLGVGGGTGGSDIQFTQFSGAGQIIDGNGVVKSGNTLSIDAKTEGGLVIENDKLAIDLGANSITGTLAIGDGGTGATTASAARTNLELEGIVRTTNQIEISANIIPDVDDTYDIGSAEKKIRDIYVSDNSLWIGDTHKISQSDGKLKFRKRKLGSIPQAIIDLYGTGHEETIISEFNNTNLHSVNLENTETDISNIKLNQWLKFYENKKPGAVSGRTSIQDIFRDNTEDYDEEISADAWLSSGTYLFTTNYSKIGIGITSPKVSFDINSTDALKIPIGTTEERPTSVADENFKGCIRYNITGSEFEGFDGTVWGSLGGVKDIDGDTYITAQENTDDDTLRFYTDKVAAGNVPRMLINAIGNIGIGLEDPTEKLEVDGKIKLKESLIFNNEYRTLECDNQNLIVWYKFDGDLNNSVVGSSIGTLQNTNNSATFTDSPGNFVLGKSALLNNTSLTIPDFNFSNLIEGPTKNFTISFWFKASNMTDIWNVLVDASRYSTITDRCGFRIYIRTDENKLVLVTYNVSPSSNNIVSLDGNFTDNNWRLYTFIFEYNSNTSDIYSYNISFYENNLINGGCYDS